MKKVRLMLMALAITLGVGSAVAVKAHNTITNKKFITYQWQKSDASGNVIIGGAYYNFLTYSQAQSAYGCSGSTGRCAVTVTAQDGQPISNPLYVYKN
jgi:hypothetical protein